jgi:hypothetical protein
LAGRSKKTSELVKFGVGRPDLGLELADAAGCCIYGAHGRFLKEERIRDAARIVK